MKQVGGFWFPAEDKHCAEASQRERIDLDMALKYVANKKVCIQAGGNCGVWATYLAARFEEVWTFEPDFENYLCLMKNIPANVNHFLAALGHKQATVGLDRTPKNCGAHQTNLAGGVIPMMTIDGLELDGCDFIQLDVEGMEPLILEGAQQTIDKFKPVLMIEDKDISRRYGYRQGWTETKISGYRIADRIHNDVILVPN